MRTWTQPSPWLRLRLRVWLAALALLVPAAAHAQYGAPELAGPTTLGEKYHVEVSGSLWNPDLLGVLSSEQFGLIGSKIDFVNDLGYTKTRFKDFRLVLRPGRKSKFLIQYTPLIYQAETKLKRDITFNGQKFPFSVPLTSEFDWKIWRLGYEYDALYTSRGFVGLIIEGRYTEMAAQLASPLAPPEYTDLKAPLPAIGLVSRIYPLHEVAINMSVTGFKLPDVDPKYQANYYDWNVDGTVNVTNNVGLQIGWRRMTTYLNIKKDTGDLKFQGMWFGAALRY